MVALEPGEPMLIYFAATTEVVSMVLVAEQSKPKQPQALKGAPITRFGSQDPDPREGPCDQEAFGSQLLEPTLSPKPQIRSQLPEVTLGPEEQGAFRSKVPEPTLGPDSQHTTGSQLPEAPSGPMGQEPPAPEPMEIDPLDP
jgi:hypothetical protein